MKLFHSSVEGGQHGKKGLAGFLKFAKDSGATGCQPSSSMLEDGKGRFLPAAQIRGEFEAKNLLFDGVSAHCPFWVHGTAWTGTKTVKPFLPPHIRNLSTQQITAYAEDYIYRLFDLLVELKVRVCPMFWGQYYGPEVAAGYPWGFYNLVEKDDADNDVVIYDLIKEGDERFRDKTAGIRKNAKARGIKVAHEVHKMTAAQCARDFLHLVKICDNDPCMMVNGDHSHCWDNEDWQTRFDLLADFVVTCHMKNYHIRPGVSLSSMEANWQKRGMQFDDLENGTVKLVKAVEQLIRIGYPGRYCVLMETKTAPLIVEAEGAFEKLDSMSARGIAYVNANCCFDIAEESFEAGMGDKKKKE